MTVMQWVHIGSMAFAIVMLVPVFVVCVECLVALGGRRLAAISKVNSSPLRAPVAVLIPAHNEAACLRITLDSVLSQLRPGDRALVVADNCTDNTADLARSLGVEVVIRKDEQKRGKGYALEFGVQHLASQPTPPAVVIIIDADCTIASGTIDALIHQTLFTGRPAQAIYLMAQPSPTTATPLNFVSALAFLIRNGVRLRGLHRMRLPCPLTGSGMAFPFGVLLQSPLGGDNLVEDLQLGVDLTLAGCPAMFCEQACVVGQLPHDTGSALAQRTRWEHGHLQTALTQVPRLLLAGVRKMKFAPIALALDLCVPPLSLLMFLLLGGIILTTILAIIPHGSWAAARLLLVGTGVLLFCLTTAWARFGRAIMPAASLLAVPFYILWKLPLYARFLIRRQSTWVKTPRSPS